jgi:hypothetical protein
MTLKDVWTIVSWNKFLTNEPVDAHEIHMRLNVQFAEQIYGLRATQFCGSRYNAASLMNIGPEDPCSMTSTQRSSP